MAPTKRKLPENDKNAEIADEPGPSASKSAKHSTNNESWDVSELIREHVQCAPKVACSLKNMFAEEKTVPFIARYRQHCLGDQGLSLQHIRQAHYWYQQANAVKSNAEKILTQLRKSNVSVTHELETSIRQAKSSVELENLYAPYKPEAKGTLGARARALGLDKPVEHVLNGHSLDVYKYVKSDVKELNTLDKVWLGMKHVLAEQFNKSSHTIAFVQQLASASQTKYGYLLKSTVSKSKQISDDVKNRHSNYHDFTRNVKDVEAYQILAINRGETEKALTVRVDFTDHLRREIERQFKHLIHANFLRKVCARGCGETQSLCDEAIQDCWQRLTSPMLHRTVRPDSDEVLLTGVFYLPQQQQRFHRNNNNNNTATTTVVHPIFNEVKEKLQNIGATQLKIAIGDGTGCRDCEEWVVKLINAHRVFQPISVQYTIVSECGSSVYSVSKLAEKELPMLQPNLRSAVSIARRLQDPLGELVKIEPKHLGVGMYQHSVNEKALNTELESVIQECVSLTGVDVNTASIQLLQRVAGLNQSLAAKIIQHRNKIGRFSRRQQLRDVKGIGPKSFEQCAGFIRIHTSVSELQRMNTDDDCIRAFLDSTNVHPESYELAKSVLKQSACDVRTMVTTPSVLSNWLCDTQIDKILTTLNLTTSDADRRRRTKSVIDDMKNKSDCHRQARPGPVFRQDLRSLRDLRVGDRVCAIVRNVVSWGAFVDIGVGQPALLHRNNMAQTHTLDELAINMSIECVVNKIELNGHKPMIGVRCM